MKLFELSEQTAQLVRCLQSTEGNGHGLRRAIEACWVQGYIEQCQLIYARKILERDHLTNLGLHSAPRRDTAAQRFGNCRAPARSGGWAVRATSLTVAVIGPTWLVARTRCRPANTLQRRLHSARTRIRCVVKTMRARWRRSRAASNDLPTFSAVEWAISLSPRKKKD